MKMVVGLVISMLFLGACSKKELSYDAQLALHADKVFSITPTGKAYTGGTAFLVKSPSGKVRLVTNDHVCHISQDGLMVAHSASGASTSHKILLSSREADLCVLEAGEYSNSPAFSISQAVDLGAKITITGYPELHGPILTSGYLFEYQIISVAEQIEKGEKCEGHAEEAMSFFGPVYLCVKEYLSGITNVSIKPGSSGSPVLNDSNQVVGVAFAGSSGEGAMIIPLSTVKSFLQEY